MKSEQLSSGTAGAELAVIDHDVHLHTRLSACCHDETATPQAILDQAAAEGLHLVGFADHLWDSAVPGASQWYEPQNLEHILRTRQALGDYHGPVKVLLGCETEYCGDGKIGITAEAAAKLDFVLVPISHLHMHGFTAPANLSPRQAAELMVKRFLEVVQIDFVTGIAHPFLPLGYIDQTDAVVGAITDAELRECFGRAADRQKSIEIHLGMFQSLKGRERDGFRDATYDRVLTVAREAGCRFHFASDAHRLEDVGSVKLLEPIVRRFGIRRDDMSDFVRGV